MLFLKKRRKVLFRPIGLNMNKVVNRCSKCSHLLKEFEFHFILEIDSSYL